MTGSETDSDADGGAAEEGSLELFEHLDAVRDRLGRAEGMLLCTDFDGTLAPITEDPDAAGIIAANEDALRELTDRERVELAVVSGREVEDVAARVGIDDITYAGNHGLELTRKGEATVHPIAADRQDDIAALLADLDERLAGIEGCVFEDKEVTATIHYRGVNPEDHPEVEAAVEAALEEHGEGLSSSSGKEIFEVGPAIPWDKGRLISLLAEDTPPGWIGAYLGDDTTDETAFEALGEAGLSVFVGGESETAARYRVPDPEGVARFFEWLASEGCEALANDR
ncbi:trehalose-phosphatase [Halobacteriales archaeon QS_3_64_16]|nr:MAG: trehalose-phosphatase [Halobacteriales archaeon QS_3_64_16]